MRKAAIIWLCSLIACAILLATAAICNAEDRNGVIRYQPSAPPIPIESERNWNRGSSVYSAVVAHVRRQHPGDVDKQLAVTSIALSWQKHQLTSRRWTSAEEVEHYARELPKYGISTQCLPGYGPSMPSPGGVPRPVPVPVPRPPNGEKPDKCPPGEIKVTEEQIRQIAEILWEKMKAEPDKFRGPKGDKGDKGDSVENLVVEFLGKDNVVVPELTQEVSASNPRIVIPPVRVNMDYLDSQGRPKNGTMGVPLGDPLILNQGWKQ